ncbi:MAG: transferase [Desulfovibrionaceae bacterium]|nr:transferase [Desulfovibrionaceae bacterium]
MRQLEELIESIAARVNVNVRGAGMDVGPLLRRAVPEDSFSMYYAFYALTSHHPLYFRFEDSSLAGTYFLGKCDVAHSVLYKSDIRGDELKERGTEVDFEGIRIRLVDDEIIRIRNSFLVKTLVHNSSKDPESPEVFKILNTVALHYANIHGTNTEGCFLGPFSTVDLSMFHNCVVGAFSYVQAGDLSHETIGPGRVWIRIKGKFEFDYSFPEGVVEKYVSLDPDFRLRGEFVRFLSERKEDFVAIYSSVQPEPASDVPEGSFVSPYAVVKGDCRVGENVLVAQRAHIEDSYLGSGANAQENCYILNSTYEGLNVTAHGGKVIHSWLGRKAFVGFNAFVRGREDARICVGAESIVMPHTIIDAEEPIDIPPKSLVWGYVRRQADLERNRLDLDELAGSRDLALGGLRFSGHGRLFVEAFARRIEHILEENGAYYDGRPETRGHAQKTQNVSFNILQPFLEGGRRGMYPRVAISDGNTERFRLW